MFQALYPNGQIPDDAEFIAAIISEAISKYNCKLIVQYTNKGLYAMVKKTGHNAYWYMTWTDSRPQSLETGNGELSIASPNFYDEFDKSIIKSLKAIDNWCSCDECGY
jgi:hypothetical protein